LDSIVEELCTLAAHAESPPVLSQPHLVEFGFFPSGSGGPEEGPKSADKSEINLGRKIPERLEVLWLETVHKVHGRDEARLGGAAAHEESIRVMGRGVKRLHYTAMQCNLGCEICKMQITYSL
jgi:hypothetical protein